MVALIGVPLVIAGALTLVAAGSRPVADATERTPVFAAPWAIIAHGPFLGKSVAMADWSENHRLMLSISDRGTPIGAGFLARRPYIELALFWGPEWKHLAGSPDAVARLRPDRANQHATFFPARGNAPAAMVLNLTPARATGTIVDLRVVDETGLAVLSTHDIPVRLPR